VPGVPYIMVLVQASIAWAIGSIAEGLSKQPDALAMAALSGPTKVGVAATTVMPGTPRGMNVVQKPMTWACCPWNRGLYVWSKGPYPLRAALWLKPARTYLTKPQVEHRAAKRHRTLE